MVSTGTSTNPVPGRCYASICTPATHGFRFLRQRRSSIEHMGGQCNQSMPISMMIRFATSSNCPRSLQRRRNGWRASGGRMPGVRWSTASLLPMTSQRIRRRWVPSYPTPGIDRGKYRYLDEPCSRPPTRLSSAIEARPLRGGVDPFWMTKHSPEPIGIPAPNWRLKHGAHRITSACLLGPI